MSNTATIITAILGLIGALFTAYLAFKGAKPKSSAEAKKMEAEVLVTFSDEWKVLYRESLTELKFVKKELAELRALFYLKEEERIHLREEKNEEIRVIKENHSKEIASLNKRIDDLETELEKYTPKHLAEMAHSVIDRVAEQATDSHK
jgi:hypothetical protein